MVLELTPDARRKIQEQIDAGRYPDASAVIEDAIALLADRERLRWLRDAVDAADAQIARGEFAEWTPELEQQIFERARRRAMTDEPVKPEVHS